MLSRQHILELFEWLNALLQARGEIGEVGIVVGGALICLAYNARAATKDVAGIFEPTSIIRELAKQIAESESLPPDWLNDSAQGFIMPEFSKQKVLPLSNLRVRAPEPRYMLAMKCISARWDPSRSRRCAIPIKVPWIETP